MNKMTKEEYEAWASIPEQPELGDLIKEVARLKKALAEQKRLILEEVVEKYGDYRYIGQKRGFGRYEIGRALRFYLLPHTKHKKGDGDNLT